MSGKRTSHAFGKQRSAKPKQGTPTRSKELAPGLAMKWSTGKPTSKRPMLELQPSPGIINLFYALRMEYRILRLLGIPVLRALWVMLTGLKLESFLHSLGLSKPHQTPKASPISSKRSTTSSTRSTRPSPDTPNRHGAQAKKHTAKG